MTGSLEARAVPTAVKTPLFFTDITTGAAHTCALSTDQELYCWGSNHFQQLLVHPEALSLVPIPLAAGRRFRQLDGGGLQTCAIDEADAVFCWGGPWGGTLTRVPGTPVFSQLSVGTRHACGLTGEGEAFCFGENTEGQLGDGTFIPTPLMGRPVAVDTELRFVSLSAGSFHTCAVTVEGAGYCWGRDNLGQLGDGDSPGEPKRKPSPTRVIGPNFKDFVTVSAGHFVSCAITDDNLGYCWGFGTGSASQSFSTTPVEIGS